MSEKEGISVRLFDKSKVVLENEIGSGSFGKVYKATISDGQVSTAAVKVFRKELNKGEASRRQKNTAYEELLKLAVLDHENIVKLYGVVQDASELPWLVFEFMKDGNLLEYVIKTDNIKEKTLLGFCRDICCGMQFLHSHKVLHKDLAARNILLNGKTAKIADLGLSSFLTNDEGDIYALNGKLFPYRHAAKECIVEQVYSFESDVWSFGILMFEIFTGGLTPYGRDNKQPVSLLREQNAFSTLKVEVRRFIVEGITPLHLLEPHCSIKIILLMKSILNPNMAERPTFQKLHKKFLKLVNGTFKELMSKNNTNQQDNAAEAFSAFHKIKANGLSSSINNLQIAAVSASNGTDNHVLLSYKKDNNNQFTSERKHLKNVGHLTVVGHLSSKSSSTSDIQGTVEASANTMHLLPQHFSTVRSLPGVGRRHSFTKFTNEIQLDRKRNSDENYIGSTKLEGSTVEDEPRRRANSGSRDVNNALLKGFVQNRFTRKS